jgi:hypothetical protein
MIEMEGQVFQPSRTITDPFDPKSLRSEPRAHKSVGLTDVRLRPNGVNPDIAEGPSRVTC